MISAFFKILSVAVLLTGLLAIMVIKNISAEKKKYINELEKFIETKVSSISTSPEREDTILIENPF